MTQKELLYVEDAVGHEENIINICNETLELLGDEELICFIKDEIKRHKKMYDELINMLEVKSNE